MTPAEQHRLIAELKIAHSALSTSEVKSFFVSQKGRLFVLPVGEKPKQKAEWIGNYSRDYPFERVVEDAFGY